MSILSSLLALRFSSLQRTSLNRHYWSCSTADIWIETGKAMAEGMLKAAGGEVPDNVVNPEVLDRPGFRAKLMRFAENRAGG